MRLSHFATFLALALSAASVPDPDSKAISRIASTSQSELNVLVKRKGGGGGGGGGRGGSSGGGRSSSSSGASSRTGSSSNQGGATRAGSGPSPAFGRGFYGGGAPVPYSAGKKTPKGLIAGVLLAPTLAFALLPGLWLWSVYPYYYNNPYRFYNASAVNGTNPNGTSQSLPVVCLCQEYSVCGCDENNEPEYLDDLVGNGSWAALNKTLVTVSDVNGTTRLVINGTLPNGTTAPGGTDEGVAIRLAGGKYVGYWVMGLIVLYTATIV